MKRRHADTPGGTGTLASRSLLPPGRHVQHVAAGGAVGALARVGLAELFPVRPGAFPWTTFAENISGAFALALVLTLLMERTAAPPEVRLAVCTGALGAFTTYSTLAGEIVTRVADGRVLLGIGYGLASVTVGLLAAVAGVGVARRWPRRSTGGGR